MKKDKNKVFDLSRATKAELLALAKLLVQLNTNLTAQGMKLQVRRKMPASCCPRCGTALQKL